MIPALAGLALMGACGDGGGGADEPKVESPVGEWTVDWDDAKATEFCKLMGVPEQSKPMVNAMIGQTKCSFAEDGTCWLLAAGNKVTGKWTQDGESLNMDPDNDAQKEDAPKITIKDGKIEMIMPKNARMKSEFTLTFSRAK